MKTILSQTDTFQKSYRNQKNILLVKMHQNLGRVTVDACICLASNWLAIHAIGGLLIICVMRLGSHIHFCCNQAVAINYMLLLYVFLFQVLCSPCQDWSLYNEIQLFYLLMAAFLIRVVLCLPSLLLQLCPFEYPF